MGEAYPIPRVCPHYLFDSGSCEITKKNCYSSDYLKCQTFSKFFWIMPVAIGKRFEKESRLRYIYRVLTEDIYAQVVLIVIIVDVFAYLIFKGLSW